MRKSIGLLFATSLFACNAPPPPVGELDSPVLTRAGGFRWTNPIDYEWDGTVTASMQSDIATGLGQYEELTTLKFHHGVEAGRPHIQYTVQNPYGGDGSFTDPVDPTTGTTIHLAPSIDARTIVHETGHALGLAHEQKRGDSSSVLDFQASCAIDPTQFSPNVTSPETFGPFDRDSVMEYGSDQGCIKVTSGGGIGGTGCTCLPLVLKGTSHTSMAGYFAKSKQLSTEDINGLWHMYGPKLGTSDPGDRFGAAVAVGDFDADGYEDLAVGAPGEAPGSAAKTGVVYLYKGTWEGLVPWRKLEESDWGTTLHDGDDFGSALLAADVDGDGVTDLLVGAPSAAGIDTQRGGAVYHYQGYARDGLVARYWYDQESLSVGTNETGDLFGSALAAGDFDGDGLLDIAVGGPGEKPGSGAQSGYVYVLRGTVFGIMVGGQGLSETALGGTGADGDGFGTSLAAGDLDLDGHPDLVIGAPGNGGGAAFIYMGGGSSLSPEALVRGPETPAANDAFGKAIAIGDFDGVYVGTKRKSYIAVGAPGRSGSGRIYVLDMGFNGSMHNLNRWIKLDQTMVGFANNPDDNFGSVLSVGDPNRDLNDDLLVGVPAKTAHGFAGNGAVELFAGNASSLLVGWTAYTQPNSGTLATNDHFGAAVAPGYFRNRIPPGFAAGAPGKRVNGNSGGSFFEFVGVSGGNPAFGQTVTQDLQLRQ